MIVVTDYPEGGYWAVFELQDVGVIVALLLFTCKSRGEVLLTFFSTAGSVLSWVFVWVGMPEKEAGLRQWGIVRTEVCRIIAETSV